MNLFIDKMDKILQKIRDQLEIKRLEMEEKNKISELEDKCVVITMTPIESPSHQNIGPFHTLYKFNVSIKS